MLIIDFTFYMQPANRATPHHALLYPATFWPFTSRPVAAGDRGANCTGISSFPFGQNHNNASSLKHAVTWQPFPQARGQCLQSGHPRWRVIIGSSAMFVLMMCSSYLGVIYSPFQREVWLHVECNCWLERLWWRLGEELVKAWPGLCS